MTADLEDSMRAIVSGAVFGLLMAVVLGAAVLVLAGCSVPIPGQPGPMVNIGTVTVTQSPTTSTSNTATASSGRPWPAPDVRPDREPVDRCKDCGS